MLRESKIKDLADLAKLVADYRSQGKTVVHCHGVFDLMHIGHIRHFQLAKSFGDILVVTVTPDQYVNKGPGRPVFTQQLRADAISALDCVDAVAINEWPMATDTIRLLRPNVFVKGSEFRDGTDIIGAIPLEREAIESVGGEMKFTDDITFSSSNLLNRHLSVYSKEVESFLASFSARHSSTDVLRYLEDASKLRVLVVGEAIIDEYQYCEVIGKSGKEPILAARYVKNERFAGGILAIANHVASFAGKVGMLTCLGDLDSQEDFIRENLSPKVEPFFLYRENTPTIVKRRFLEQYPFQKLFELYIMTPVEDDPHHNAAVCHKLLSLLPEYDVVIVADYGHGFLGPEAVSLISNRSRFLAVNAQTNAENRGFNPISRYHRADFISTSENEIRLEVHSRVRDLRDIVREVSSKLKCTRVVVTRGKQGCLCYSGDGFEEIPAFTTTVVDRVGAGDAVFGITALCAQQGAPVDILGFIGCAVGAEAVTIVGNRTAVQRVPLIRHIEHLMK
jgi:rfaE bifunctional protein nucleotidyltransferase chain/domain